jgi:hypothetical protein
LCGDLIRSHLKKQDDSSKLTGHVEADETPYGGRPKAGMTMLEAQTFAKARKVGPDTTTCTAHPAHITIRHPRRVYASGDVHTQTIEHVKTASRATTMAGPSSGCSPCVNEYAWRYNHRVNGCVMFAEPIRRAADVAQ